MYISLYCNYNMHMYLYQMFKWNKKNYFKLS